MDEKFYSEHWLDSQGNPAGGVSSGLGITVSWQNGPLGRGDARKDPNGAFVETVIAIALDRLQYYQKSRFSCLENQGAIAYLEQALDLLDSRTRRRELRGIEGTHEGN